MSGEWLGKVEQAMEHVTVRFKDGSICRSNAVGVSYAVFLCACTCRPPSVHLVAPLPSRTLSPSLGTGGGGCTWLAAACESELLQPCIRSLSSPGACALNCTVTACVLHFQLGVCVCVLNTGVTTGACMLHF